MLFHIIRLFKIHKDRFESDIATDACRGMIYISNKQVRDGLIPSPKHCLAVIDEKIPETIKIRTEIIKKWVDVSTKKLQQRVSSVEEYVDQNNNLISVNDKF